MGCRTGWRVASLTACSALLAGCGTASPPKLEHADAAPLIALVHRIGTERGCARSRDLSRLRALAIGLVNAGRVPDELQEPMLSGISALGEFETCAR